MAKRLSILIAGDHRPDGPTVRGLLKSTGIAATVRHASDLASTEAAVATGAIDFLLLDGRLAAAPNLRRLGAAMASQGRRSGLIVLADRPSNALALRCVRAGAADCLDRADLTPARFARIVQDRDRLHRLEADLLQTRHHLAQVVASAPMILWATDRKGVFTLSEGRDVSLLGLRPGEAVGKSIKRDFRERPDVLAKLGEALSGKTVAHVSATWGYTFDTRWAPLRDARGRITGAVGIATDVTDRAAMQRDLQESEDRFRALADSAPVIIWMTAPDGSCSYLNQGWREFTGRQVQHGLGRGWIDFVHPEDRRAWARQSLAAHRGGERLRAELRLRSASGQYHWMLCTGVARPAAEGKLAGFVGTMVDITEHRAAADLLRQSRDALEARVIERTADLTDANRRLARELRQRRLDTRRLRQYQAQLRSLASALSLAEERERRRIAAGLHDLLGQKLALVRMKLGELAQALDARHAPALAELRRLLVSAVEQTRTLSFEIGSPILYELGLDAALESLAESFEERHGVTSVFRSRGRPQPLPQHAQAILFQAARELMFNIAKHAAASKVVVEIEHRPKVVRLTIADDGVGFDPQRAEPRRRRTSGFGLFNIRERLGHLGGAVDIRSSPGLGSTVTLQTPRRGGARHPKGTP